MLKTESHGKNFPPLHSFCRCTTVAEFDNEVTEELQRRARDENGKPILIPQNTTYEQWKKEYVPKLTLEQGTSKNKKEKLNFQENISDFGKTKIKDNLYLKSIRKNNIIKYENIIMKKYNDNNKENLAMLDIRTGNLIGKITTGSKTSVNPSISNIARLYKYKDNSLILIHNHPKNYSFSLTDIKSYVKFKSIDTMIIKSPDYTFYLKAPKRNIELDKLKEKYNKIEKQINKQYSSFNGAEKRDLIISRLSKDLGWVYEKEKNKRI